jgi:VanZ family protein
LNNLTEAPVLLRRAPSSRVWLAWVPTLLWLCVLAWFSTDTFSAEHTGSVLRRIIHAVYGPVSYQAFQEIHFLVRKAAHFCAYGMLSALAFFSWRATLAAAPRWAFRWSALALLLTLLAGSLDEFHQSFVSSRTSNWHDVALDMTGAVCFQLVIAAILIGRNARRE